MSDELVGRYRRLYPRLWRHPNFKNLNSNEQRIALYALTGPQANRIGIFHFSVATAAEDLGLGTETFGKGLRNVCATFGWIFDAEARVFYIPSWWRWNRPDNSNVLIGNLKDLSEVPPCGLIDAFATNLEYVPVDVQQTFVETFKKRVSKRSPIQEQVQDHDQEQSTRRRSPEAAALVGASPSHLRVARQCLELTSERRSFEALLDVFANVAHRDGIAYSKTEALRALTVAVQERNGR